MGKRFAKQLGQFIVTLFGITFLTFCLTYLAPGDPVTMLLETADTIVSQELIDETRAQLGLDKPFLVQYANWVVNAAQGDLGMSYSACFLCRRVYAIILVRPCTDLYLWP